MITRRLVFKTPLCISCSRFVDITFQDGQRMTQCSYDEAILLHPNNLATECTKYSDTLKNKYWELLEEQTREIPIIGEEKQITAGFKVTKEDV